MSDNSRQQILRQVGMFTRENIDENAHHEPHPSSEVHVQPRLITGAYAPCSENVTNPSNLLQFVLEIVDLRSLPNRAAKLGLEMTDLERDRRSAHQWVASAIAYLDYKSGKSWRPLRDRFHPIRYAYSSAAAWLNQAFHSSEDCQCPYCKGRPFYGSPTIVFSGETMKSNEELIRMLSATIATLESDQRLSAVNCRAELIQIRADLRKELANRPLPPLPSRVTAEANGGYD